MRDASPSLAGPTTTWEPLETARIMDSVLSTRRTEHPAKVVVSKSVSQSGCPSLGLDMEEDQTGSRFIVSFKIKQTKPVKQWNRITI